MMHKMVVEEEQAFYSDLRDEPCILCGDPYLYVLGSYTPEEPKRSKSREGKAPVLYYTLCKKCFNNGSIPTARIEAAYKNKFNKFAA
ncbi:MAG: hypothetical protein PVI71_12480 [Desulfobacterales bacterium]|jgi:hypothetical protein